MSSDPTSGSVTGMTEEALDTFFDVLSEARMEVVYADYETERQAIYSEAASDALPVVAKALSAARSVDPLQARVRELEKALRYILGEDIAGYDAHMRPEEVARAALSAPGPLQGEKDG